MNDHLAGEVLSALIDDQLSPDEALSAHAHLTVCAECQARLEELRSVVVLLRNLPAFEPPREFVAQANVKKADFDALNASAAADYPGFWAKHGRDQVAWHKPFSKVLDESKAPFYKWFEDGELNVSYNCLERNLENGNASKIATAPAPISAGRNARSFSTITIQSTYAIANSSPR